MLILLQLDIENNSAQKVWQEVEFVFGKRLLRINLSSYVHVWIIAKLTIYSLNFWVDASLAFAYL